MVTLVFAKLPEPGRVMTRLCPPLTPAQAADVQRLCLRRVWRMAGNHGDRCILVASPDTASEAFARLLGDDIVVWPQGGGDLGARLTRATRRAFEEEAAGVTLLGADSPTLPWVVLDTLGNLLDDDDVVLGPSADGGYYLLAMRAYQPVLFERIDWSTDRVARQTRERAGGVGLSIRELPTGYDIDSIGDLRRAIRDLARDGEAELAATLGEIVRAGGDRPVTG